MTPTTKNHIGTYNIKIAQVNSNGNNLDTASLTLTIGCVVASIAGPVAPSSSVLTYTLFSGSKTIDFSDSSLNAYTQT